MQLPLHSISLGYMQEKARLVLKLRKSTDLSLRDANTMVPTGQKRNAQAAVNQAFCNTKRLWAKSRQEEQAWDGERLHGSGP